MSLRVGNACCGFQGQHTQALTLHLVTLWHRHNVWLCGKNKNRTDLPYPVFKGTYVEGKEHWREVIFKKSQQQRNVNTLQMYAPDLTGTSDRKVCVQRWLGVTVSNMKHLWNKHTGLWINWGLDYNHSTWGWDSTSLGFTVPLLSSLGYESFSNVKCWVSWVWHATSNGVAKHWYMHIETKDWAEWNL